MLDISYFFWIPVHLGICTLPLRETERPNNRVSEYTYFLSKSVQRYSQTRNATDVRIRFRLDVYVLCTINRSKPNDNLLFNCLLIYQIMS